MKNVIAIALFTILCAAKVSAQDNKLIYDHGSAASGKTPDFVLYNKNVTVEVKNVNRLIYDIEVSASSVSFNEQQPSLWAQYLMPAEESAAAKALDDKAGVARISTTSSTELQLAGSAFSSLFQIPSLLNALTSIAFREDTKQTEVVNKRNTWLIQSTQTLLHSSGTYEELEQAMQTLLNDWETKLAAFTVKYNATVPANPTMDAEKAQVEAMNAKVQAAEFPKVIADMRELYSVLVPATFSYTKELEGPDRNADEMKIVVRLIPKPGMEKLPFVKEFQVSWRLPVKGGWKFDFSTGIAVLGIKEDQYGLKPMNDSLGHQQIINEVESKTNLGITALLHVHYRFACEFSAGASFGAMLDNSKRVRYMLGGSAILGKRERLIFTGGFAYGKINALSTTQIVGDIVASDATLTMVERYRLGWFAGVSVNLTR